MAARKSSQPPAAAVSLKNPPTEEPARVDQETSPSNASPLSLRLAVCGFVVWLLVLIGLAWISAHPVTLNRRQIRQAEIVLEGTLSDADQNVWDVIRSWPPEAVEKRVTIRGLAGASVQAGKRYLIPVAFGDGGDYQLVRTPPPASLPLIYPATDDSRRQLEALRE